MHPVITIFVPFTRRWAVERWLVNLEQVEHDPALTNICLIVDCDEPYVVTAFKRFVAKHNYRNFIHTTNEQHHPNEAHLLVRKSRIAYVKNQSKDLVAATDGEYVICFEDDTIFERLQSFDQLVKPMITSSKVGFVEGVQIGRWGARMVGAWKVDNPQFPTEARTLLPPAEPSIQSISAGGFYGYATPKLLYLEHDYFSSMARPWGPDVEYGLWLRQKCYECLIDWGIVFGHQDAGGAIGWPENEKLTEVIYNKDLATGRWDRKDIQTA